MSEESAEADLRALREGLGAAAAGVTTMLRLLAEDRKPGPVAIKAREQADRLDALLASSPAEGTGEGYSVAQIRQAFESHASPDDWGVPCFYVDGLIAALRGEYDRPTPAPVVTPSAEEGEP